MQILSFALLLYLGCLYYSLLLTLGLLPVWYKHISTHMARASAWFISICIQEETKPVIWLWRYTSRHNQTSQWLSGLDNTSIIKIIQSFQIGNLRNFLRVTSDGICGFWKVMTGLLILSIYSDFWLVSNTTLKISNTMHGFVLCHLL